MIFEAFILEDVLSIVGAALSGAILFKSGIDLKRELKALSELKLRIQKNQSKTKIESLLQNLSNPDDLAALAAAITIIKDEASRLSKEERDSIDGILQKPSLKARASFAKKILAESDSLRPAVAV